MLTLSAPATDDLLDQLDDEQAARETRDWHRELKARAERIPSERLVESEARFSAECDQPTRARAVLDYIDTAFALNAYARRQRAQLLSDAMGVDPRTDAPLHDAQEVEGWLRDADDAGEGATLISPRLVLQLATLDLVPNHALRDAFVAQRPVGDEDEGTTGQMVGLLIGETREVGGHRVGDASRVERLLGLQPTNSRTGYAPTRRLFIPYPMAVRIADALHLAYTDLGL